jgi:NAD-dependent SIR2 family protein deacetylase/ankyrin repeat protein
MELSIMSRLALRDARAGEPDCFSFITRRCSLLHWLSFRGHSRLTRVALSVPVIAQAKDAQVTESEWTPLHCAATRGHSSVVAALLDRSADPAIPDANGHSALAIAVVRGNAALTQALLDSGACASPRDRKKVTPLHLAAFRGDSALVGILAEFGAEVDAVDASGRTPLLVACQKADRWPAAVALLARQASARAANFGERLSPLMLVARWADDAEAARASEALLRHGADPAAVDCFGQTALHLACRAGRPGRNIAALCAGGAPVAAQDDDGVYALHHLCACSAREPHSGAAVGAMRELLRADPPAAARLDFGDANALHNLCLLATQEKTAPVDAVRCLLAARADPAQEEDGGWTAIHFAASHPERQARKDLMAALRESDAIPGDFWITFNFNRPRDISNRKYLMRRGGAHRVSAQDRESVLGGDVSLAGVAASIARSRSRNIVVLVGAGASTSSGIPDYRSSAGLWAEGGMQRAIGSMAGFEAEPEAFWSKYAKMFDGRRPTLLHRLLARLASEGVLTRVYTQNIDGLEVEAGVPEELVVQCHGSARRAVCSADPSHPQGCSCADIWADLREVEDQWRAPRCSACGALLRPDVVFFGEPLPQSFTALSGEDMSRCDLLIVAGTSLCVYPVAGLASRASLLTPRLLINREAVGPWRGLGGREGNYRDVFFEGECDDGAAALAGRIGWDLSASK